MSPKKSKEGKGGGGGGMLLSIALGAALAAGAGYYATHKEEVDEEAKKRIAQMAKAFHQTRAQVEKRVKQVWGNVSDDAVATYMDVRGSLINALEEKNVTKTGQFLQSNYNKLVDASVKAANATGMLDATTGAKLAKSLKMDWEEVRDNYLPYAHKAAAVARTSLKKAAAKQGGAKKAVKKVVKKAKTAAKKVTKKVVAKKSAAQKAVKKTVKKVSNAAKKSAPKKK